MTATGAAATATASANRWRTIKGHIFATTTRGENREQPVHFLALTLHAYNVIGTFVIHDKLEF